MPGQKARRSESPLLDLECGDSGKISDANSSCCLPFGLVAALLDPDILASPQLGEGPVYARRIPVGPKRRMMQQWNPDAVAPGSALPGFRIRQVPCRSSADGLHGVAAVGGRHGIVEDHVAVLVPEREVIGAQHRMRGGIERFARNARLGKPRFGRSMRAASIAPPFFTRIHCSNSASEDSPCRSKS